MLDSDRTTRLVALSGELMVALREYDFSGRVGLCETARGALDAYVDAMRASDYSPESLVIMVKHIARQAGFGPALNLSVRESLRDRDQRLEGFVSYAIHRYFRLGATTMYVAPIRPAPLVC